MELLRMSVPIKITKVSVQRVSSAYQRQRGEHTMFKASAIAIGVIMLTAIGAPVPAQDRAADKAAVESAFKDLAASYATNDLKKTATLYNDPFLSIGQGKAITAPEL